MNSEQKIPVGVSSCLLGNEVRHDGGHKRDAYINGTLAEYFDLRPLCPEMGIGMGAPRPPIRLVATDTGVRALGVKDPSLDVTDRLLAYSRSQADILEPLCGYILKKASPSCGMERVKLYNSKGMPEQKGVGLFARTLMEQYPLLPVEEEGRLGDPRLRENFIQRVFVYWRWRSLETEGISVAGLTGFHARLKLTLMSHNQDRCRALGRLAAEADSDNLEQVAAKYIAGAMACLKKPATRKNHVNVLHHIQGYLKRELDSDDKRELLETIADYGRGQVPLVVPLTLFKHHFRRCPDPYIDKSWYFSPYPDELKLRTLL